MRAKIVLVELIILCLFPWVTVHGQDDVPPGIDAEKIVDGFFRFDQTKSKSSGLPLWWQLLYQLFKLKPTSSTPPFGRSVAFLVGVSRYKNLQDLKWISKDLTRLRNFLLTQGGFDTVYEMREDAVNETRLREYLNKFSDTSYGLLRSNDRLLIFYSGHGADQQGKLGYLLFKSAEANQFGREGVFPVRELVDSAKVIVAKHLLIILDSCASGLAVTSKAAPDPASLVKTLSGEGSGYLMTAGTGKQEAYQMEINSQAGYSVLTDAILKVLEAGVEDPQNTGFLTIHQIYGQVQTRVAGFEASQNKRMEPRLWSLERGSGEVGGTFVFINEKAKDPKAPVTNHGDVLTKSSNPGDVPPPAAVKPTATLSADRDTIKPGESVKLTWTTTDAINMTITPDIGSVTAQGTTKVTPLSSTTYTLTGTGPGGSSEAIVHIVVNNIAPAPYKPAEAPWGFTISRGGTTELVELVTAGLERQMEDRIRVDFHASPDQTHDFHPRRLLRIVDASFQPGNSTGCYDGLIFTLKYTLEDTALAQPTSEPLRETKEIDCNGRDRDEIEINAIRKTVSKARTEISR